MNIDTTSEEYLRHLTRFRNMRTILRPRLRRYHRLSAEKQAAWLERDILMREIVQFADRLSRGKPDDD